MKQIFKTRYFSLAIVVMAFSVTFFLALSGCNTNTSKENAGNVMKIGIDIPLTGSISSASLDIKKGIDLFFEMNKDSNKLIKIIYEDNQGQVNKAISIFNKFNEIDKVCAVVSAFTPICKALREQSSSKKMPLVATITSASDFSLGFDYAFRDFPHQKTLSPAIAKYTYESLKLKRGVFFVVNDDFGKDGSKIFSQSFEKIGGKIVGGDYFNQSENNFRNQISKLFSEKVDFVYMVGRDMALVNAVKQVREYKKDIQIIGVIGFDTRTVWENIGEAGEGIIFSSAYTDYSNKEAIAFKEKFEKSFSEEPNYLNVYGYTIAQYLSEVVKKAAGDKNKIQIELSKMNMISMRGNLRMDSLRDVTSPLGIYKRENGKNQFLQRIEF